MNGTSLNDLQIENQLKKMEKKRWIFILISSNLLVFIFSWLLLTQPENSLVKDDAALLLKKHPDHHEFVLPIHLLVPYKFGAEIQLKIQNKNSNWTLKNVYLSEKNQGGRLGEEGGGSGEINYTVLIPKKYNEAIQKTLNETATKIIGTWQEALAEKKITRQNKRRSKYEISI